MKETTAKEARGIAAVKKLRISALKNGESFLIYDERLPPDTYYLEFPDGSIEMITMSKFSAKYSVRERLGMSQSNAVRRKFDFPSV